MAGKDQPIIIKKKIIGGGHGHHGGAWKVAYADFVTAMMAFFLVMWLLGADEETKQAVAHYFNHPNTPYKAGGDPHSDETVPLGDQVGRGESVVNGSVGLWPEDLIERPASVRDFLKKSKDVVSMIEDVLGDNVYNVEATNDGVKFALPDNVLFEPGSDVLSPKSASSLSIIGKVLKDFKGYLVIAGHTDNVPVQSPKFKNNWELSLGRASAVMQAMVKNYGFKESQVIPVAHADRHPVSTNDTAEGRQKNRRVEFILTYKDQIKN